MDAIPFGIRDRLARLLFDPAHTGGGAFDVPFFGLRYSGRFDSYIDWYTWIYGAFAKSELFAIDRLAAIRPGLALDIGANTGHHTLFLATRYHHVHAFDPVPDNTSRIAEKLERNGITNVTIHGVALGDADGEAPFYGSRLHNTGTGSLVHGFAPLNEREASGTVRVVHGSDHLDRNGVTGIAFVKIDTEGYERPVLEGLRAVLSRERPLVQVEISARTGLAVGCWGRVADMLPSGYVMRELVAVPRFAGGLRRHGPEEPLHACDALAIPEELLGPVEAALPVEGG